jgi:hypothetical protein
MPSAVVCSLCGERRARRGCPALGHQICAVCCGTKRLVQIACPSDCAWLASAREHPPAVVVRRHQRDVGTFVEMMRDFNDRQSRLFLLISTFLARYEPPALQPLIDDDVGEAMAALAATFETAARGVIYEHRPASLPAERLVAELKPLLAEAGKGGGTPFERDAAAVMRRVESVVREVREGDRENRSAFLDMIARLVRAGGAEQADAAGDQHPTPSPIIVP